MTDVDITSLSVEISAESQGAELNIDKLATAISNLRTKGNVAKVYSSLDKLSASISALKSASTGLDGLSKITSFMNGLANVDLTQSAKGIRSVANALNKISSVNLGNMDFSGLGSKMNSLKNGLSPISSISDSSIKSLRGVSSAINSIAKIPSITKKLDSKTLDDFAEVCKKVASAISPLASKLDKVGRSFSSLPSKIKSAINSTTRFSSANWKASTSLSSLASQLETIKKRAAQLVSLKAIATYLANAVAKFNDFYEATDLFHNAMGNLSGEADTLISKMQGLLGVDPTKAMTYMATIQSLGTSFGLTSDKAYILSKNLTQLAYDEGSYWNKDVAETFTAMSSAISGEIEPIRRLGIDLSQARLQQELLALGFNKQVSSLSQADKAVLRYIAIMKQTANVQGNLAQTIQSPANQIKILKAQLDMLAKSFGSLLYPAMKSILPPLIAAVQLIREFVEWVAKLMGVKVVFTDFTKSADSVGGIGDAMDDTADSTKKAAKALKDYTMGFDELNIIDPTQGSSGSGSGASAGNILGDVDLSGYDMFKQYNEEFAKQIDAIKQKIKDMLPIIGAITAALALWKIADFLTDIATAISKMTELQKLALSIATVVVEASLVFSFAKGYASSGNPLELLGEVVSAAFGSFVLWRTMGADGITLGMGIAFVASLAGLTYALGTGEANLGNASTWIQAALTTAFGSITGITLLTNLGVAAGTAATLSIGLAGLITFAGITFSLGEKLKEFPVLNTIIAALMGIFGGVAGAGVALLVGASLPVAGAVAAAGVGIGLVLHWAGIKWGAKESGEKTDAAAEADTKMHYVENVFEQRIEAIKQIIVTKWNAAIDFMTSLPGKAGNIINSIGEWFNSLPEKIGYALGFAVGKIGEWVGNMVTTVTTEVPKIVSSVVKFFEELPGNILTAILKTVDTISEWRERMVAFVVVEVPKIISSIVGEFKKLPDELRKLGKFIWDGLINGLKDAWSTVTNGIKSFTDGFVNGFKDALEINSPSQVFHQIGVYVDQGLANGITAAQGYVDEAMQGLINGVTNAGNQFIEQGKQTGIGFVNNLDQTLTSTWQQLDTNLQNDFFGTIQNLWEAAQSGDVKTIGTTIAAVLWHAMGEEQRTQIKTIATNMITDLSTQLTNALSTLSAQAYQIGGELLNGITSKFGEILQKTKQLGGSLSSTFQAVRGPLKSVATAISAALSGGLASAFPTIYASMGTLISTIGASFVAMLNAIGAALSATIFGIPAGLVALGAAAVLAASIAGIVGGMGGKKSSSSSSYGSTGYDESDLGQIDYSNVPGTSQYNDANSGLQSSYTASATQQLSASEIKEAVYNGAYNALLDYKQRYSHEDKNNIIKLFIDGKQVTAAVEKTQSDRGRAIMGNEAYSY